MSAYRKTKVSEMMEREERTTIGGQKDGFSRSALCRIVSFGLPEAILLAAFVLVFGCFSCSFPQSSKPNLIVILVDALRADRLGCYGYEKPTSPNIDKLAAEGALLERAFVQRGITWPSVTSIMTSQYPAVHCVRENGEAMDLELTTIAKTLSRQGYDTAAFLGNMLTASHPGFLEKFPVPEVNTNAQRDAYISDKAIEWLRNWNGRPFFAFLHYMAPHKPYEPPEEYLEEFDPDYQGTLDGMPETLDEITLNKVGLSERDVAHVQAIYDACVKFADTQIGRVLEALSDYGLRDNTVIVVVADHGEELYERNCYFYHGCSMYDGVLRIPTVLSWPEKIAAARRVQDVKESIDLGPTVLELLSVPCPESFQGTSFASGIAVENGEESDGIDDEPMAFSEWQDKMATVRTERWRYVWNPKDFRPTGNPYNYVNDDRRYGYEIPSKALYDLQFESSEKTDVSQRYPEVCHEMERALRKWTASLPWKYKQGRISDQSMKEIKSMGYVR